MPTERLIGTLARLRDEGYAFIHVPGKGDFYAHINEFRDRAQWIGGLQVEFTPGKPKPGKAPPAYDVVAVSKE